MSIAHARGASIALCLVVVACGSPVVATSPSPYRAPMEPPPPSEPESVPPSGNRIIEHEYGSTEIPAHPQRVVALSEEFLLADLLTLGVTPIASTSNDAAEFGGLDVEAIEAVENLGFADVNVEQVAALRPDLSQIDAQLDEASTVVDGVEMSVLSISPGPFIRAYTDDRTTLTEVMVQLGVTFVPGAEAVEGAHDNGRIELSLEQLGLLSGNVLVLLQTTVIPDEDAAVDDVRNSPLWSTLPAVRHDAVVTLDRLAYPGAEGIGRFATDLADAVVALGPAARPAT